MLRCVNHVEEKGWLVLCQGPRMEPWVPPVVCHIRVTRHDVWRQLCETQQQDEQRDADISVKDVWYAVSKARAFIQKWIVLNTVM